MTRSSIRSLTSGAMTDRICAIALREKAYLWWWVAFVPSMALTLLARRRDRLSLLRRHRHLGHQLAGHVGFRHLELRVVDCDRLGRHDHLGAVLSGAGGLARFDQPDRRVDDALRGGGGGHLSHPALGEAVVFLLAVFLSEHHDALGAVSKPAALGFLGAFHLCPGLGPLLVFRAAPGSCERARSGDDAGQSSASMACSPAAFGARAGSGSTCARPMA